MRIGLAFSAAALAALAVPARAVDLNVISKVEVKNEGASILVTIEGNRPPSFTTFSMTDPPRFVIDLSESQFQNVPEDIVIGDDTINLVKNLSYGSAETSIARVMVAFNRDVDPPDVQTAGTSLVVRIARPAAGGAGVAQAKPAAPEAQAIAEAAARAEAQDRARAEAEAKARADAEAQAKAQAEAQAKAQAEAQARADAAAREAQQAAAAPAAGAGAGAAAAAGAGGAAAAGAAAAPPSQDQAALEAERARQEKENQEAVAWREAQKRAEADARKAQAEAQALEEQKQKAAEEARLRAEQEQRQRAAEEAQEKVAQAREAAAAAPAPAPAPAPEAAAPAPPAKEELAAVERGPEPERLAVPTRPRQVREIGFRQMADVSRVFVRLSDTPSFQVTEVGENVLQVELANTRVLRRNDTRFLDTSYFPSAVAMVTPRRQGTSYVVEIKLRQRVPWQQKVEGDTLAIDFERPASLRGQPAAAPAAPAPAAEPAAPGAAAEPAAPAPAEPASPEAKPEAPGGEPPPQGK